MTRYRYLVLCLLLMAIPGAPVSGVGLAPEFAGYLVKVGLAGEDSNPSSADPAPELTKACEQVSFTRSLRYGDSDHNVLDGTTGGSDTGPASPRTGVLLGAGEGFSRDHRGAPAA